MAERPRDVRRPFASVAALYNVSRQSLSYARKAEADAQGREPAIAPGTATQIWRGDKTWVEISSLNALIRNACMVRKAADLTGVNFTGAALAWDSEVYDDGAWHSNAVNNSRLTVPAGVTRVRLGGTIAIANAVASVGLLFSVSRNGTAPFDGRPAASFASAADVARQPRLNIASGQIPVTAGDYFEATLQIVGDTSVDIDASRSNFWIEAC